MIKSLFQETRLVLQLYSKSYVDMLERSGTGFPFYPTCFLRRRDHREAPVTPRSAAIAPGSGTAVVLKFPLPKSTTKP
jgi:hypothetical protein